MKCSGFFFLSTFSRFNSDHSHIGLTRWCSGKETACQCRRQRSHGLVGSTPGREDPLEEEMATDSSILAWRIPGTEEPGGLQSLRSQKSQT